MAASPGRRLGQRPLVGTRAAPLTGSGTLPVRAICETHFPARHEPLAYDAATRARRVADVEIALDVFVGSSAAVAYYSAADYLATTPGEWLGKGAATLGLTGASNQDHFISLAHNMHPQTGEKLRPRAKEGERVGLDLTFNASKSVSIARELADGTGDDRIEDAHREAVGYVVGLIEKDMQGRVRQGYANANRTTGNLVAYRVTHRDTRINADDQMPDPQLHDHVFVFNATFDPVERQWKAAELGQIKHDLPFFEAAYHNRLASNLKAIGYGVERKGRAFEIAGIDRTADREVQPPEPLHQCRSRQTGHQAAGVEGQAGGDDPTGQGEGDHRGLAGVLRQPGLRRRRNSSLPGCGACRAAGRRSRRRWPTPLSHEF